MIKKYLERTSVRNFDKKPLPEKDLKVLIDVINASPTSTNSHQFSAVIVTDQAKKDMISKWNYGQQHIKDAAAFVVFIADRTRIVEALKQADVKQTKEMVINDFHRALVDGTIAATYAHDALIDLGYGTTFVGGITSYSDKVQKLLEIPETAFPFLGLSFGKATHKNGLKPKLNKVFINTYNKQQSIKEFWDYDQRTIEYFKKINVDSHYLQTVNENDENSYYGKAFGQAGKLYEKNLEQFLKNQNLENSK